MKRHFHRLHVKMDYWFARNPLDWTVLLNLVLQADSPGVNAPVGQFVVAFRYFGRSPLFERSKSITTRSAVEGLPF